MDHFSRLIHLGLVAVVLLVFSAVAYSADCPTSVTKYRWGFDDGNGVQWGGYVATPEAACSASSGPVGGMMTFNVGSPATQYVVTGSSAFASGTCTFTGTRVITYPAESGGGSTTSAVSVGVMIGSAVIVTECDQCAAQAGKQAFGGVGEAAYDGGSGANPAYASSVCVGGCKFGISADAPQAAERSDSGNWTARADAKDTKGVGSACAAEPAAAPPACAKGTAPGSVTINGTTTNGCYKVDQSSEKTPETIKSQDPGASAPGPVTTITKSTKCDGDRCTTTVTTTITGGGGSGGGGGTEVTSEGKSEFCGKSPKSKLCGTGESDEDDPSNFGGSCAETSCTGDAVQCAIAREQAKRACEMKNNFGDGERTHSLAVAGDAALTAGETPDFHPRNAANVVVGGDLSNGFDQARLIGGACPGDRMVGRVMVPFSVICNYANILGNVLVGICAIACLGIVFKGS